MRTIVSFCSFESGMIFLCLVFQDKGNPTIKTRQYIKKETKRNKQKNNPPSRQIPPTIITNRCTNLKQRYYDIKLEHIFFWTIIREQKTNFLKLPCP